MRNLVFFYAFSRCQPIFLCGYINWKKKLRDVKNLILKFLEEKKSFSHITFRLETQFMRNTFHLSSVQAHRDKQMGNEVKNDEHPLMDLLVRCELNSFRNNVFYSMI